MERTERQANKRNHHFVPKFYLKGFTDSDSPSKLWVYTRGRDFDQGDRTHTWNPYKSSIGKAGMGRDFYACKDVHGKVDYNTFENELEKKEKPADKLIRKICGFQPLNENEKEALSLYMTMMHQRIPKRFENLRANLPDLIREEKDGLLNQYEGANGNENTSRGMIEKAIDYLSKNPDEILLRSMLEGMPISRRAMTSMRWQYFVPPIGDYFVTSDCPLFHFENLGLDHSRAEFVFPISSKVAIVGSWYMGLPEVICHISSEVVQEINRRTCVNAHNFVYAKVACKRIYDLMQDHNGQLPLLYNHIIPNAGLPLVPKWVSNN